MAALQPFALFEGRGVAAEIAPVHLEAQQGQPVLQAQHREIVAVPGEESLPLARQVAAQAPQGKGVETGDDHLAFGNQHPLHLPQHLVRVRQEFQDMGQNHQIEGGTGEGQLAQVAAHIHQAGLAGLQAQGNAVVPQVVHLGQAQLQGVEAEDVRHQGVDLGLLPFEYVAPLGGLQPGIESGN